MKILVFVLLTLFLFSSLVSAGSEILVFDPCTRIGDVKCTLKLRIARINDVGFEFDDFEILNPSALYDYKAGDFVFMKVHLDENNLGCNYDE